MSKKIVAVSLALFLIVTCFVACGKKYETTKINGKDVVLVTDEDGDPVINNKNQVIALVTDEAGEIITYSNGEEQTRYIDLDEAIEVAGIAYGEHYKINVLEGWEVGRGSKIYKNETDNKCFIDFAQTYVLKTDEKFEDAFAQTDKTNEEIQKVLEDEAKVNEFIQKNPQYAAYKGCKYEIDTEMTTFTRKNYPCKMYVHKFINEKNEIIHYVNSYYFLVDKTIYCVSYNCIDGVGYDQNFDFDSYLKTNFTFVE